MQVGDKVIIAPRRGRSEDYSFYYIYDMQKLYDGKTATIVSIGERGGRHKGTIPDDSKRYVLDIDKGRYDWASSMLLPVNTSTTD